MSPRCCPTEPQGPKPLCRTRRAGARSVLVHGDSHIYRDKRCGGTAWLMEHISTLAPNALALRGISRGGQELCPQGHPVQGRRVPAAGDARRGRCPPVMLILADHLEVPSRTLCFTAFICCVCVVLVTPNTSWISSKISGLLRSRIFMRSLSTMMMFWVRSSAPCLELFSAAPATAQRQVGWGGQTVPGKELRPPQAHHNEQIQTWRGSHPAQSSSALLTASPRTQQETSSQITASSLRATPRREGTRPRAMAPYSAGSRR